MIKLRIRPVALGIVLTALTGATSLTAVLAAGGGGGGGGGSGGGDPYGGAYSSPGPTPSYPNRADTKTTPRRVKKADKRSFLDDPAFKQGYRAAYDTIYDRHDYTAAIDQLEVRSDMMTMPT